MRTSRIQSRVAAFAGAIVLLLQVSPAMAGDQRDKNRPVIVTFTKWVLLNSVNMEGVTGGAVPGVFVGETLQAQMSVNPDLKGKVIRLEVVYEVQDQDGERDFTALIGEGQTAWRESACSTASSWLGGAPARGCRWPGSGISLPIPSAWTQAHPQT